MNITLTDQYLKASQRMKTGIGGAAGSTADPMSVIHEIIDQYDHAYQDMVKHGLAPQLRRKYLRW